MVLCEISIGELLDKLTILHIKMDMIKNKNKIIGVEKEYKIIYEKVKNIKNKVEFYYYILKNINKDIWISMDKIREYKTGSNSWIIECKKSIDDNDRRFRVKKKINDLTNSSLKEQKGYEPKKAFVLTHLGLGDNITAIGMVRYLSTCYDEVVVVCKNRNKKNMELFYQDDDSIKIYNVENDKNISPRYGFNINKFKQITKGYSVYLCGNHNLSKKKWTGVLPLCFYEQIDLDPQIFWNYFYVPIINEAKKLYDEVLNKKYVFVHNTSSTGKVFNINFVEEKLNLDRNEILFINPNLNSYTENHEFFDLANKFLGHKLSYYTEIIKNAEYNIVCDSSFMCMAINLELKNNNNYYYSRDNRSYDKLYSDKYIFKSNNMKKIFKSLN